MTKPQRSVIRSANESRSRSASPESASGEESVSAFQAAVPFVVPATAAPRATVPGFHYVIR